MDIPNLSQPNQPIISQKIFSAPAVFIVLILGITAGFWLSRIAPQKELTGIVSNGNVIPIENVKNEKDLQVGKIYGDTAKNFTDTATGTIEQGSINGEGTHILNREGGATQRASLTSSVVDLDLFVGKKVEIKGETNASNKTAWLLDVGTIKILE